MGAYVSKPVTEKASFEGENETISYGASSMQGWRISQEDAHNAIIDYDKATSFFAVYDGHGGHEVAEYTAQKLPEFIRDSDCYQNGDLSQALVGSFLKFDANLVTPEILNILKEISGTKDTASPDSDKEEVDHLCREASMPLEDVIAKYSDENLKFQSPFLKAKKLKLLYSSAMDAGCSGSSSLVIGKFGLSESDDDNEEEMKESSKSEASKDFDSCQQSTKNKDSADLKSGNDVSSSSPRVNKLCNGNSSESRRNVSCDSPSDAACVDKDLQDKTAKEETCDFSCDDKENSKVKSPISSTDIKKDDKVKEDCDLNEIDSSGTLNGETNGKLPNSCVSYGAKGSKKDLNGKGKKIPEKIPCANKNILSKPKRLAATKAEEIYRQMQEGAELESSSDIDEEEDDGEIEASCHDEGDHEDSDEVDDEDDSTEDEEEDLECDGEEECVYSENQMSMAEEPGFDSGCTACVILLRGSELYVANVGDSRCVICRGGEAFDMSLDHKPEDEPEAARITKAGGKVTEDGRVNGGLNLSRALGDHSYKQNKTLTPEEQMISPLPDIKTLSLEPKDRFMILACDGIWNSMTSQEACDFVSKRLDNGNKLSSICEQLFDFCLAPNIEGDGAGCDNMTCIIISLGPKTNVEAKSSIAAVNKRPFTEVTSEDKDAPEALTCIEEKKIKLDTEAS